RQLYLETASTLSRATAVYKHMGYCALSQPIANDQGHTAMDIWMIKDL
ncbi:TPA: GNAT family N-acetyltransferase, partial [Streptococcus agalactiae]|nr:GNAT family N-acetyltransferase [Streptococcus agalactiae]